MNILSYNAYYKSQRVKSSGLPKIWDINVPAGQKGLMAAGDVIAQKLIEKNPNFNIKRTAKFVILASLYVFKFLERPLQIGASKVLLKPWQKVAIDQTLFAPTLNLFALPILGLLNGDNVGQIKQSIAHNYTDIMLAWYKIWPAAQLVNFYFVPFNYRVVFVSSFSLVWNSYIGWKLGEK